MIRSFIVRLPISMFSNPKVRHNPVQKRERMYENRYNVFVKLFKI